MAHTIDGWTSGVAMAWVPKPNLTLDRTLHVSKRLVVDPGANNSYLTRPHLAAIVRF